MSNTETHTLTGIVFDESTEISIVELCQVCSVDRQTVTELIAEGILEADETEGEPRLPYASVRRTRTVLRLQRDLCVNLAGAALALELLDRIEALRAQLRNA